MVVEKNVHSFQEMKNISKRCVGEYLINNFTITHAKISTQIKSKDGTIKFLFCLEDGSKCEGV